MAAHSAACLETRSLTHDCRLVTYVCLSIKTFLIRRRGANEAIIEPELLGNGNSVVYVIAIKLYPLRRGGTTLMERRSYRIRFHQIDFAAHKPSECRYLILSAPRQKI